MDGTSIELVKYASAGKLRGVLTVPQTSTLQEGQDIMANANIGFLVITDGTPDKPGKFVGVFSERDNMKHHRTDRNTPLKDLMRLKSEVSVVQEDTPAKQIPERMLARGINHIPIVNDSGDAVAVISIKDVLHAFEFGGKNWDKNERTRQAAREAAQKRMEALMKEDKNVSEFVL